MPRGGASRSRASLGRLSTCSASIHVGSTGRPSRQWLLRHRLGARELERARRTFAPQCEPNLFHARAKLLARRCEHRITHRSMSSSSSLTSSRNRHGEYIRAHPARALIARAQWVTVVLLPVDAVRGVGDPLEVVMDGPLRGEEHASSRRLAPSHRSARMWASCKGGTRARASSCGLRSGTARSVATKHLLRYFEEGSSPRRVRRVE